MKIPNPSPFIGFDKKQPQYYKGMKVKADTNLHEQIFLIIEKTVGATNDKISILDLGCGEGALSQKLYDNGYNVISADIDERNFKSSGPVFHRLDFNNSNDLHVLLQNYREKFSIILAVEILEHLKDPWEFIQNVKLLCNCGTHVFITIPNISSWWARLMFLLTGNLWGFDKDAWKDPGHINPISSVEMEGILVNSGFKCLEILPCGQLPVIWCYNWKRLVISIIMLPFYLIMKGNKNGGVLCFHAVLAEE